MQAFEARIERFEGLSANLQHARQTFLLKIFCFLRINLRLCGRPSKIPSGHVRP